MKLVVPIVSDEEVIPLVKAGADEFYCGIFTDEFEEMLGFSVWNKRPALRMNFRSFKILQNAMELAHDNGKKVFLTVNSLGYVEKHYGHLEKMITSAYESGADGFIVSDLGMIHLIKQLNLNCELHISTTAAVYNSEAVSFYKELGATRIIFPRHIGIDEMKEVIKKEPAIEYEIFMKNSRCPNEDGLCTIEHALNFRNKLHGCFFNRSFRVYHPDQEAPQYESFCRFIEHACGACVIPELIGTQIGYLKIVGRERPIHERIKDSIFLKRIINHMTGDGISSKDQAIEMIRNMHGNIYKEQCDGNCYYPERSKDGEGTFCLKNR